MYGYLTLDEKIKMDRRLKREYKAIQNIKVKKGSYLIFEEGCVNVKVIGLELVKEDYDNYYNELLIYTEYDSERKPIIKVSGVDLIEGKVKLIKDRKYKTISKLRLDW